ncbi:MAG: hypothetical protein IJB84_07445 [Lachnospiraceae bacterium]|nr:hypothetical protein [Lachnospiraceae bacterium]
MNETNKHEETKHSKDRKQGVWLAVAGILLLITAGVMYLTHRAVPFMMDDLWYSTNLSTGETLTGWNDVVESQIWHYNNWGGRVMTHGLLQLVLLAGETVADLLNVVVFFALGFLICKVAGVSELHCEAMGESDHTSAKRRAVVLLYGLFAASSLLLGLNANWKMSMFWQSGAVNYLYSTPLLLLFLYLYLKQLQVTEEQCHCKCAGATSLAGLGMMALGVFVGWSNENMGPTVWILSLIVMILVKKEQKKFPLWMLFGNMAALFGSVMVILAPGNFVRSGQSGEQEKGILWRMFLRGYGESKALFEYLFPTLIVLALVFVLAKALNIAIGRENLLLMLGALLSWGAMILSPHYPDRATFGTMVLLICVILSLGKKILTKRTELLLPLTGATVLIWLGGMFYLGEFLAIAWGWIR